MRNTPLFMCLEHKYILNIVLPRTNIQDEKKFFKRTIELSKPFLFAMFGNTYLPRFTTHRISDIIQNNLEYNTKEAHTEIIASNGRSSLLFPLPSVPSLN